MNRRQIIAGAAALPLAGIAADVQAFEHLDDADPALNAYQVWRDAWQALQDAYYGGEDDEAEQNRLHGLEWEALTALTGTIATTQAGVLGQMIALLDLSADMKAGGKLGDPDSYTFGGT